MDYLLQDVYGIFVDMMSKIKMDSQVSVFNVAHFKIVCRVKFLMV